jgi:DNA (cytosine-5)-methyltransferase 1
MGLPETYVIPKNHNQALHLAGDGVAIPVVSYLEKHLFTPLLNSLAKEHNKDAPMIRDAA